MAVETIHPPAKTAAICTMRRSQRMGSSAAFVGAGATRRGRTASVSGRHSARWTSAQTAQATRQSEASMINRLAGQPRPPPRAPISETAVIERRASAPCNSTRTAKAVPYRPIAMPIPRAATPASRTAADDDSAIVSRAAAKAKWAQTCTRQPPLRSIHRPAAGESAAEIRKATDRAANRVEGARRNVRAIGSARTPSK